MKPVTTSQLSPITRALLELGPAGYLSEEESERRRSNPQYMRQLCDDELARAKRLARSRGWIR